MKRNCDVLIIGAGVLGCFAARSLSRYDLKVIVLEKEADVCCGISKANSGIIYRGYDQYPGSLKAKLCRQASDHFPDLCAELDIPFRRCGLLMLSFGPSADQVLLRKMEQGKENGITDIRLIDSREVYEMEPGLSGGVSGALYAENTFTVNPWDMGIAAFENAAANHAEFFFQEEVLELHRTPEGFFLETNHHTYQASRVLCCAGVFCDRLWEMAEAPRVRILPQAADYLIFDKAVGNRIRHVISVEPEKKGNGLTLVPTVGGNILAGPTRRDTEDAADTASDLNGIRSLKEKCQALLPSLPMDRIIRSFATVRPNPFLINPDGSLSSRSLHDFTILEQDGLFALIGIKTPGLTCACETGEYIAGRILRSLPSLPDINPDFSPIRRGIPRTAACIRENSALPKELPKEYYEMICRCEHVSKGEILEAIRRGARTIDGVKRRTGAGMGRCQGGYCMEKILHLLHACSKESIYSITKDGPGSEILLRSRAADQEAKFS